MTGRAVVEEGSGAGFGAFIRYLEKLFIVASQMRCAIVDAKGDVSALLKLAEAF
jgi:hypothetical protein